MRSIICARYLAGAGVGIAFLTMSASALSAPINVGFTLQQDGNEPVVLTEASGANLRETFVLGDVAASVSFIFDDVMLTGMGTGVAEINVNSISIVDRTSELDLNRDGSIATGSGLLEGTNFLGFGSSVTIAPTVGGLVARFDRDNGNAFLGLAGFVSSGAPIAYFGFNSVTLSIENATGSITSFTSTVTDGGYYSGSYAQVPEPTALVLLGAGLVGFGFARKVSKR